MNLMEFLNKSIDIKELTDRLLLLDKSIMDLHQNGYFVTGSLSNIEIFNNEITLSSFKNNIERTDSGYDSNGINKNILEMAVIGVCVYNRINAPINNSLIRYVSDNLENILSYKKIPVNVGKYYQTVISDMQFDYLNNYLNKINLGGKGNNANKARVYSKSTAVGRALANEHDTAYVNILMVPSILFLVYIVTIVTLFLLKMFE